MTLDRIELDLGVIAPDRFETEAPAALERALREALARALAEAGDAGGNVRTSAQATLEEFETFLVRGIAPLGGGAPPRDALRALIEAQPAALTQMLRRRAGARYALERLAMLITDPDFAALLALLAPGDVAVILTYLAEMDRLHPASAAPRLASAVLRRILRVFTLEHLLSDPGGSFNRKRYAEALLRGLAQAHGMAYRDLLDLLVAAVPGTLRRRPIAGSLPDVLSQLAGEAGEHEDAPPPPKDDPVVQAGGGDLAPLLTALRLAASRPTDLDRLVRRLDAKMFARLIAALEPAHAEVILTYAAGMAEAHAAQPVLPISEAAFELRLRRLALRFLLHDAGSSFNRRAWLRRLLTGLARESGVGYADLLAALTAVIEALRAQAPPRGQLPVALSALAADLPRVTAREQAAASGAAALRASPAERLAAAEQFLRANASSGPGPDLAAIAADHPTAFADLLRRLARAASDAPGGLIGRLLGAMAPQALAEVLRPGEGGAAARWAEDLVESEGLDMASAWTRVLTAGLRGDAPAPPARAPRQPHGARRAAAPLARPWNSGLVGAAGRERRAAAERPCRSPGARADRAVRRSRAGSRGRAPAAGGELRGRDRRKPASGPCTVGLRARRIAERPDRRSVRRRGGGPPNSRRRCSRHGPGRQPGGDGGERHAFRTLRGTPGASAALPAPPRDARGALSDAALLAWLAGEGRTSDPAAAAAFARKLAARRGRDRAFDAALRKALGRAQARERLAAALPHALLAELVRRLVPELARLIDDLIAVLALASADPERARRTLWATASGLLTAPPSARVLADRLMSALASGPERERLKAAAAALARRHGHAHLAPLLAPDRAAASVGHVRPRRRRNPRPARPSMSPTPDWCC